MKYYDNIIIGSGIAGLFMAYNIKKNSKETYIILEKNDKKMVGGRVCVRKFHGIDVNGGAGIGRLKKDFLLMKLLDELNLSYKKINIDIQFSNNIKNHVDVMKTFNFLKKSFNNNNSNLTFKEFALTILNKKEYKDFKIASGLTDYENEDVIQTLKYYGMDDNSNELQGVSIPWKDLINGLIEKIDLKNIKFNKMVNKIIKHEDKYEIVLNNNSFICNKVFIATDIDTIKKLLNKENIYKEIKGQKFLRIYAKFSGKSVEIMNEFVKKTTIVSTSLYKIIKINSSIYMICYSDNKGATDTMKIINEDKDNNNLTELLKKSLNMDENIKLKIDEILIFYWKNGTHYYKPLNKKIYNSRNEFVKKAQNPNKNMFVIGEVVSMKQGWCEGALESVNKIL
jgi:hypothetical protein